MDRRAARAAGLEWFWVELADADPLSPEHDGELAAALLNSAGLLHEEVAVVIHCSAGIHRTGMFTYALLRHLTEQRGREAGPGAVEPTPPKE